ncbi:hypothetical protein [Streptomyces mirabilis]
MTRHRAMAWTSSPLSTGPGGEVSAGPGGEVSAGPGGEADRTTP